jgi:transcriptional regulator with XRE-family HTH domain
MPAEKRVGRARTQDVDRHVGARMRQRRVLLGLTQPQIADLIGVTYQQAHKYEKGMNRIAAGRLYTIAQALGVEVGYFFEGLQSPDHFVPTPQQRMILDLARHYLNIPEPRHREAIVAIARALAEENVEITGPRDGGGRNRA